MSNDRALICRICQSLTDPYKDVLTLNPAMTWPVLTPDGLDHRLRTLNFGVHYCEITTLHCNGYGPERYSTNYPSEYG